MGHAPVCDTSNGMLQCVLLACIHTVVHANQTRWCVLVVATWVIWKRNDHKSTSKQRLNNILLAPCVWDVEVWAVQREVVLLELSNKVYCQLLHNIFSCQLCRGNKGLPQGEGRGGQRENQNHQQGGVTIAVVNVPVIPSVGLGALPTPTMRKPTQV